MLLPCLPQLLDGQPNPLRQDSITHRGVSRGVSRGLFGDAGYSHYIPCARVPDESSNDTSFAFLPAPLRWASTHRPLRPLSCSLSPPNLARSMSQRCVGTPAGCRWSVRELLSRLHPRPARRL